MRLRLLVMMAGFAFGLCTQTALAQSNGDDGWVSLDDIMREEGVTPVMPQPKPAIDYGALGFVQPQRDTLAAGDQFRVTVVGHKQLSKIYTVDDYGEADLDLVGPLIVRGLSLTDLSVNIERLYNRKYLRGASVKIERYVPPVIVAVAGQEGPRTSISVPASSTLLDVMTRSGRASGLTPGSVIIVKDPSGRTVHVVRGAGLGRGGYQGPAIAANQTITVGEWHKTISKHPALKTTPYLDALMQRSLRLPPPF